MKNFVDYADSMPVHEQIIWLIVAPLLLLLAINYIDYLNNHNNHEQH